MSREARPTIRCLTEDLGVDLPGLDVSLGELSHPWLDELRRIADTSPQNQKRVLSIAYPLVYRLRISDQRGATWVDEEHNTVWLCAAHRREEGSDDDAYEWFAQLHAGKALLPTEADLDRLRADAVLELFHRISAELCHLVDAAVARSGYELREDLGGWLPCRALVIESQGTQEVWCALSVRDVDNHFVREELRNVLFAALEAHLAPIITEARSDWPSGVVEWFEVVRLGVR